jgi:hypothetical protein
MSLIGAADTCSVTIMNRRVNLRGIKVKPVSVAALKRARNAETAAEIGPPVLKRTNLARLKKALLKAERLARGRDHAADDAALRAMGIAIVKTDWSFAARRAADRKNKRKK